MVIPQEAVIEAIEVREDKDKWKNNMQDFISPKSGSSNRFALLDTIVEKDENLENELNCDAENEQMIEVEKTLMETRKSRATSAGVAELMKTLKPKKKGPIDKGRNK